MRCRLGGGDIEIDLLDVGWGGMNWIAVAQDRDRWGVVLRAFMNIRM